MKKTLLSLSFTLLSFNGFSQTVPDYVTLDTNAFTVQQLVTNVLVNSPLTNISNFTSTKSCGFGYFNRNNSDFPFKEGMVIRNGNALNTQGKFNNTGISTACSGVTDADLQAINCTYGNCDQIQDASFVKFNFVAGGDKFSFRYLFASNEYGQYQCHYSDAFAFILTDLDVLQAIPHNLAVIPGTATATPTYDGVPVSVTNVRQQKYNGTCSDSNPTLFGQYNSNSPFDSSMAGNPSKSAINMFGQTVALTASSDIVLGHHYSLKLVIGDYRDDAFDSTVFIEAGSFNNGQSQLGLNDDNKLLSLTYSPNPVKDVLNVNSEEIVESVSVINMLGQELYRENHDGKIIQTDMSAFSAGTYFVKVQANDKSAVIKVVKE